MPSYPTLQDPTGRVMRVVTSQDELQALKDQGYVPVRKATANGDRDAIDPGAEGNRAARRSSTTEGSEKNSGRSTPNDKPPAEK